MLLLLMLLLGAVALAVAIAFAFAFAVAVAVTDIRLTSLIRSIRPYKPLEGFISLIRRLLKILKNIQHYLKIFKK